VLRNPLRTTYLRMGFRCHPPQKACNLCDRRASSVSPTTERRLKISDGFNSLFRLLRAGALAKCQEK
jgi:hypothetical protein